MVGKKDRASYAFGDRRDALRILKLIKRITDCTDEAYRGAFRVPTDKPTQSAFLRNRVIIFGIDGYGKDPRAKAEVKRLREFLNDRGIRELAFITDVRSGKDEFSWGMMVETHDSSAMFDLVWEAWRETWHGKGYELDCLDNLRMSEAEGICSQLESPFFWARAEKKQMQRLAELVEVVNS